MFNFRTCTTTRFRAVSRPVLADSSANFQISIWWSNASHHITPPSGWSGRFAIELVMAKVANFFPTNKSNSVKVERRPVPLIPQTPSSDWRFVIRICLLTAAMLSLCSWRNHRCACTLPDSETNLPVAKVTVWLPRSRDLCVSFDLLRRGCSSSAEELCYPITWWLYLEQSWRSRSYVTTIFANFSLQHVKYWRELNWLIVNNKTWCTGCPQSNLSFR